MQINYTFRRGLCFGLTTISNDDDIHFFMMKTINIYRTRETSTDIDSEQNTDSDLSENIIRKSIIELSEQIDNNNYILHDTLSSESGENVETAAKDIHIEDESYLQDSIITSETLNNESSTEEEYLGNIDNDKILLKKISLLNNSLKIANEIFSKTKQIPYDIVQYWKLFINEINDNHVYYASIENDIYHVYIMEENEYLITKMLEYYNN